MRQAVLDGKFNKTSVTPGRTWNQPEWCYTPDCTVLNDRDEAESWIEPPDSLGERHGYRNFYVSIDLRVDNQALQEGSTGIRILSNPVKDVLKWESSSPLESWRVLDVSGRVVGNGGGDCRTLDVSSLPPGLYLFSGLARNGRTETVKFVKR